MSGSFQVPMGVTWKGEQYTQKGTRGCGLAQPFEEDGDLGDGGGSDLEFWGTVSPARRTSTHGLCLGGERGPV